MDITHPDLEMLTTYRNFVVERHSIWEKRRAGAPQPWTTDPVLAARKFTNVFRVLDHGSQFLLTELLNDESARPIDVIARAFLYRMTNRPQIWERTRVEQGRYPYSDDLDESLADYWAELRDGGVQAFSGAYVIMPRPGVKGDDKLRSVVQLATEYFSTAGGPDAPGYRFEREWIRSTMPQRFEMLHSLKGVGKFLAMQILTDYGYSPYGGDQYEDYFVVAGPGARNGAAHLIDPKHVKAEEVIDFCQELILDDPACPMLEIPNGQGVTLRVPSRMDIQNTLCEFSKYVRYLQKSAKLTPYSPEHPGQHPEPEFPAHWH